MWIKSDVEMADNPKLIETADALSLPPIIIAGALHHLWWWVARNRPTGDVSGLTPEKLGEASGWPTFVNYQIDNQRRSTSQPMVVSSADWVTNLLARHWIDYSAPQDQVFPARNQGVAWCDSLTPLPPGCVVHDWIEYAKERLQGRERAKRQRQRAKQQ